MPLGLNPNLTSVIMPVIGCNKILSFLYRKHTDRFVDDVIYLHIRIQQLAILMLHTVDFASNNFLKYPYIVCPPCAPWNTCSMLILPLQQAQCFLLLFFRYSRKCSARIGVLSSTVFPSVQRFSFQKTGPRNPRVSNRQGTGRGSQCHSRCFVPFCGGMPQVKLVGHINVNVQPCRKTIV